MCHKATIDTAIDHLESMPMNLKESYLFATLDDDQLAQVEAMSKPITLIDGERLFHAGDTANHFFLVQSGQIKLLRTSLAGDEKVIELVNQGATFAEAVMFMDEPRKYPVTAEAIGNTEILSIKSKDFLGLLRNSVDTCFRVMGDMSFRLQHMIKEIDDLTLQSATGRVAGYLCGQNVFKGQQRIEFDLNMPKGVLASRLSVKPETFSRILHTLSDTGLVNVTGGHIEILDLNGLRAHAESAGICGKNIGPAK